MRPSKWPRTVPPPSIQPDMVRRTVTFTGRVQGVGFRATARDTAAAFRVSGWVRNEPDGTVRLEVQGRPDAVENYLDALRLRMARFITGEQARDISPAPGESDFAIQR